MLSFQSWYRYHEIKTSRKLSAIQLLFCYNCQVLWFIFSVIQNSFKNIEMKMLEVGILTFQKLFESHPSAKTKFLGFKDLEITDLRGSDMFHNHVSRVMATIKRVRLILYQLRILTIIFSLCFDEKFILKFFCSYL